MCIHDTFSISGVFVPVACRSIQCHTTQGCTTLLVDEDTCATNFMIRDMRMQMWVSEVFLFCSLVFSSLARTKRQHSNFSTCVKHFRRVYCCFRHSPPLSCCRPAKHGREASESCGPACLTYVRSSIVLLVRQCPTISSLVLLVAPSCFFLLSSPLLSFPSLKAGRQGKGADHPLHQPGPRAVRDHEGVVHPGHRGLWGLL